MSIRTPMLTALALASTLLAGCLATTHEFDADTPLVMAFSLKDDHKNTAKDPQRLADALSARLGRPVTLYNVDSDGAAIQALRFGHAHAAFFDGGSAWIAWQKYGLEAIAADVNSDGRPHYVAQAWVRNSSDIQSLAQLEGRNSCHTGWLKSAGMLMPMGYLIRNNIAPVVGASNDIMSLQSTIDAFFDVALVPETGSPYYNYQGAFRCLTEGVGDVAFVKDSSYEDHCAKYDWCLERSAYRKLEPAFGAVPSHPVMASPKLPQAIRADLTAALLSLNDSPEGRAILGEVLETKAITATDSQTHLGEYGANLQVIPGLEKLYRQQYKIPE
jgi:ABC-type phosphate/phosphonate transport system substrate-binding protein